MKKTFYFVPFGVLVAGLMVASTASTMPSSLMTGHLKASILDVGKYVDMPVVEKIEEEPSTQDEKKEEVEHVSKETLNKESKEDVVTPNKDEDVESTETDQPIETCILEVKKVEEGDAESSPEEESTK